MSDTPLDVGATLLVDGSPWTVVDVAPAFAFAEMAAQVLDDEGVETAIFAVDPDDGRLYAPAEPDAVGTSVVLVPEGERDASLAILARELTDYTGDDLEALVAELGADGHFETDDATRDEDEQQKTDDSGADGARDP